MCWAPGEPHCRAWHFNSTVRVLSVHTCRPEHFSAIRPLSLVVFFSHSHGHGVLYGHWNMSVIVFLKISVKISHCLNENLSLFQWKSLILSVKFLEKISHYLREYLSLFQRSLSENFSLSQWNSLLISEKISHSLSEILSQNLSLFHWKWIILSVKFLEKISHYLCENLSLSQRSLSENFSLSQWNSLIISVKISCFTENLSFSQ